MREMSVEMASLLKSKMMVGENAPSHEVLIKSGSATGLDFGDAWVVPSTTYTFNSLSVAQKANGKLIICNISSNVVMEGEATNRDALLAGNDGTSNWSSTGITATANGWAKVFNLDGGLYLNFSDSGVNGVSPARKLIYKSPSGNGGDWELYSTIQNWSWSGLNASDYAVGVNEVGIPIKLDNGNWIMGNGYFFDYYGYLAQRIYIMTSSDSGVTWSNGYYFHAYAGAGVYYREFNAKIVKLDNGELFTGWSESQGSNPFVIVKSVDNGVTWSIEFDQNSYLYWPDNFYQGFQLFNSGNNLYSLTYEGGSASEGDMVLMAWQTDNLMINETIATLPTTPFSESTQENAFIANFGQDFIVGAEQFILGFEPILDTIQTKSIQISRDKNIAGQLNLAIDNKDGVNSVDVSGVLLPNVEVVVKQGYGEEKVTTFTGLIDRVEMRTFPQEVLVTCRDKIKLALDQLVTVVDGENVYRVVTYTDQTVEAIFTDLCTKAGLSTGTVETTGVTLSEKTFSWETYGDAFQWLADLVGFEFTADEDGLVHFRADEAPTTPTVAYIFKEGEDIVNLGYVVDDNELYYDIYVYGAEVDGTVVYGYSPYYGRTNYNVLEQKILKIDAPDCDTYLKCQEIANRTAKLMASRARIVTFQAIGIPWLQIGDFIQVIESSTTISEIYRITGLQSDMTPEGYTMTITCYYHSYGEVE